MKHGAYKRRLKKSQMPCGKPTFGCDRDTCLCLTWLILEN